MEIPANNPSNTIQSMTSRAQRCLFRIAWVFGLMMLWFLIGCGIPQSVKDLSAEQKKVTAEFSDLLKKKLSISDSFAESQFAASRYRIMSKTSQIIENYREFALADLDTATSDNSRDQILKQYTNQVTSARATAEANISQIKSLIDKQKEVHSRILQIFKQISNSQEKLNEYLQLKRADENILQQFTGILSIEQQNLKDLVKKATEIEKAISKVSTQN